jgi:hypothetical protein
MRHNEGRFSSYVLPRIVRLTVETNSLTGASRVMARRSFRTLLTLHPAKASVAIVSIVLYVAFPVSTELTRHFLRLTMDYH